MATILKFGFDVAKGARWLLASAGDFRKGNVNIAFS